MNDNENRKWLHQRLQEEGYDVGDYNSFEQSLQDKENADWYYDKSRKIGLDVGDRNEFDSLFINIAQTGGIKGERVNNAIAGGVGTQEEADAIFDENARRIQMKNNFTAERPSLQAQVADNARMFPKKEDLPWANPQGGNDGFVHTTDLASRLNKTYQEGGFEPFMHNKEDESIRSQYTPVEEKTAEDVWNNAKNRFALTERGAKLQSELSEIQEGLADKYMDEFKNSEEYKQYAGKKYTSQAELDEANKAINDLFNERYGKAISDDMQPYMQAYNNELMSRYGVDIENGLNKIAKKEAAETLGNLSNTVDMELSEIEGQINDRRNAVRNENWKPGMPSTRDDKELARLRGQRTYLDDARELIDESENIIQAVKDEKDGTFVGGVLRGVRDKVLDIDTWTMGVSDLVGSIRMKNVLEKADKGEELSNAEQALLDAAVNNMAINLYYRSDLGRGYKAGEITGESLPFMLEFLINPISSSGSAIAQSLLSYGLKRYAVKTIGKTATKAASRFVGDAIAAGGMTATTGMPGVLGETIERMNRDYKYEVDENGNLTAHKEGDTSFGSALGKSATTRFLEYQSEMIFYAFGGVSRMMRGVEDMLPGGVNRFMDAVKNSRVGQVYRELKNNPKVNEFRDAAKFGGITEEYLEEVYNNFANVAIGEMSFEDAVSLDRNIDTFLGLAPTQVLFSAVGLGGMAYERYKNRKEMERVFGLMSDEQKKKLEELQQMGKLSSNKDIAVFIRETIADESLTPEQRRAEIEYAYDLAKQNAINEVDEVEVQDNVESENQQIDAATDPQTGLYGEVNLVSQDLDGNDVVITANVFGEKEVNGELYLLVQEEGKSERKWVRPNQYDASSYQRMPAEEVKAINEEMIREEAAAQVERESKYAPEVLNAQMQRGVPFNTPNAQIIPISPLPEGNGWVVDEYPLDTDNKVAKQPIVREMSNDEYRDLLQAQYEAQEAEQAQAEEVASNTQAIVDNIQPKPMNDGTGRIMQPKGVQGDKAVYDITDAEGNTLETDASMDAAKFNGVDEAATEAENEELPPAPENITANADGTITEKQPQAPVIPTKKDGSIDFVTYGKEGSFKELGNMYGEKMPHKVAVTAKALANDLKKAQQKLDKANEAYDNAPIGREQKTKAARDKAQQELDEIKREADFWAEMDAEIKAAQQRREEILNPSVEAQASSNEPMTTDEFVAQQIAAGNIVLNKEDYKKETGFGDEEANAMNGGSKKLFAKNGMSVQEAGEVLMQMDREAGTNFFDQDDSNAGRDALITVLGSVKSRKELNGYIASKREEQAKRDAEGVRNESENAVMNAHFASLEDFVLQMEAAEVENPFDGIDIAVIDAIFAEAEEEYQNFINNEQGRTSEVVEGNDNVLSEEQSDNTGGIESVESEGNAEGNGERTLQEDEAVHGSEQKVGGRKRPTGFGKPKKTTEELFADEKAKFANAQRNEYADVLNQSNTVAEAIAEFKRRAEAARSKAKEWAKKKYKDNKTVVSGINPYSGADTYETTIGAANERRKEANVKNALAEAEKYEGYAKILAERTNYPSEQASEVELKQQEGETTLRFAERAAKENERRIPLRKRVKEWENLLGVKVHVIEHPKDVKNEEALRYMRQGQTPSGWVEANGEVCIYLPGTPNVSEIDKTIIHEVVAHKGLKGLLGKARFDELCDKVWNMMPEAKRAEYYEYVGDRFGSKEERQRAAADEYMAFLAEGVDITPQDKSVWKEIIKYIRSVIDSVMGKTDLTDADIEELLRASFARLVTYKQAVDARGGRTMFRTLEEVNKTFNEQLQKQIDGTLPNGFVYNLGNASDELRSAGIPYLPIEMASSRLKNKSNQGNHPFELSEIIDLPKAIQKPLAVFDSATVVGSNVILTEIKQGNKNFVVAIMTNKQKGKIRINDIRSIHPRTTTNVAGWVNEGLMGYADKERFYAWIENKIKTRDYLNSSNPAEVRKSLVSAANIVKDFQNPTLPEEKTSFRVVYHGSGAEFDKFDHSKMGTGAGSQVFGWGTYLTDSEEIGRDYGDVALNGKNKFKYVGNQEVSEYTLMDAEQIMDRAGSYKEMMKRYGSATLAPGTALEKAVKFLKSTKEEDWRGQRHLYEVEIPDSKRGNYIVWGNNVTDAAAKKVFDGIYDRLAATEEYDNATAKKELRKELDDLKRGYGQGQSGIWKDLYGDVSTYLGSDKEASLFLRSLGYVGIEYPSGTIMGGKYAGSKNFVIFDEKDLKIVEHTRFRVYKSKDGKETKYKQLSLLFDEGNATGNDGGRPDSVQREGDSTIERLNHLRDLQEGEVCNIERRFSESKEFSFTRGEKIESTADVAYIFKSLEDEAVENSFVAITHGDDVTVIHLGMGAQTATVTDTSAIVAAVDRLNADKVFFVHNHPSGVVRCSREDIKTYKMLKNTLGEKLQTGIIINTRSGQYGLFDDASHIGSDDISKLKGDEYPLKVYKFNKQAFRSDAIVNVEPHAGSIAEFVSTQRLGKRDKVNALLLNNSFGCVGNVFLPDGKIGSKAINKLAADAVAMGAKNVILYGRAPFVEVSMTKTNFPTYLSDAILRASAGNVRLIDIIQMGEPYNRSAIDEGLRFRVTTEKQKQIDKEYVDAIHEGDFDKAIGLFREYTLSKAEENGVVPIDYAVGYRSNAHSSIAKKVKEVNPDAISEAAYQMSKRVPKGSILVPMPSRGGKATYTVKLAEAIAKATDSEVRDVLRGKERMSVYESKKKGLKVDSDDLGLYTTEELPKDKNVVIIDNVVDRGITALAAVKAVKGGSVLAYAFTKGNKDRVASLKLSDPITYDDDLRIIPLSERFNPENKDIRFRMTNKEKEELRASDETKALFDYAKKRFGRTFDLREAGYILPDGAMLDFSGRHEMEPGSDTSFLKGQRSVDHRYVADLNYKPEDEGGEKTVFNTDMADFLNRGAIRIDGNIGSINLTMIPTKDQKAILQRMIQRMDGDVWVDFSDGWDTEHSAEYAAVRPFKILADIDKYYNEGIKPEGNARFRIANRNQEIFVSNAERAVEGIKQEKATPQQWLAMIEKNSGLKAGEDKWLGLSDWLKESTAKTLTKDKVLNFIGQNKIVIEEVRYREEDEAYKEADAALSSFYADMEEKYGSEYFDYMNQEELDEEERLLQERDFSLKEDYATREINSTRLNYTTEGLDNKQEIALTVPTIEPWNENDEIHFGDAGEGRAVAWIRFGETYLMEDASYVREVTRLKEPYHDVNGLDIYKTDSGSDNDFIAYGKARNGEMIYAAYVNGKQIPIAHKTLEDAMDGMNKYFKEHPIKDKKRLNVLVIDEIQSKRHQEGREHGYRDNKVVESLSKQREELSAEKLSIVLEVLNKQGYNYWSEDNPAFKFDADMIDKAEDGMLGNKEQMGAIKDINIRLLNIKNELSRQRKGIPSAPFEKNWSELAFKRMLRYAAENGFDKVAWTKGEQQAERYNIGGTVSSIDYFLRGDGTYRVETYGTNGYQIQSVPTEYKDGQALAEVFGKELATKMVKDLEEDRIKVENAKKAKNEIREKMRGMDEDSAEYESLVVEFGKHDSAQSKVDEGHSISGDGLRVGGEGMKGFYDKMLPSFVNKYVKKWGTKVQDVELPNVEEAGRIMHSVDVTEAMKESVMEGQTMFRISDKGRKIQQKVDEFASKYNSVPVEYLDLEMTDEELDAVIPGFTNDELKEFLENNPGFIGGHSSDTGKIYIFVDNQSLEDLEDTMFHENLHGLLGEHPELVEEFYKRAADKLPKLIEKLVKLKYEKKEIPEEAFVRVATAGILNGDLYHIRHYLPEDKADEYVELLNNFGYEQRQEFNSRILGIAGQQTGSTSGEERKGRTDFQKVDEREDAELQEEARRERQERLTELFNRVADGGLQSVLGDADYDRMMMDIYSVLPEDVRKEVVEDTFKHYGTNFIPAISDYINAKADGSLWDKIVSIVREALRKVGFELDLNANEVRYLAWRSQKRLNRNNLLDVAEDIDKKYRLGVGEYSPTRFRVSKEKLEGFSKIYKDFMDDEYALPEYAQDAVESAWERIADEMKSNYGEKASEFFTNAGEILTNGWLKQYEKAYPYYKDYYKFKDVVVEDNDESQDLMEGILEVVPKNELGKVENIEKYIPSEVLEAVVLPDGKSFKFVDSEVVDILQRVTGKSKNEILDEYSKEKIGMLTDEDFEAVNNGRGGTRFRTKVNKGIEVRDEYEALTKKSGFQAREAVQDAMLSLRRVQELIEKATGKKLRDFENAWMHENRLSSVVQAEIHEMERKFYKPMIEAVKKLMKVADMEQNEVADYLILKHGIERNREMAVRKALTDENGKIDKQRLEDWYRDKRNVRNRQATPHLDTWRKQQEELDNIALLYGADMSRDYSGLTSMFDTDDLEECTKRAYDEVESLENAHQTETEALGKAIKALTQSTLDKSFESGLMNKAVYDELSNDMYDYYIPLRGFDETTSDEVYAYFDGERDAFNAPLRRAKGRTSKSDNPIAYMKSIAESGIMQGNRNKMKQTFLNMVINNPSDLVSVKEGVWAAMNPTTGEWEAVSAPPIPNDATPADVEAIMEQWEAGMELQAASNSNIRKITEADDVPYRVIGNRINQHQVIVKRLGKSYTLTVNGNPRLAMALNGLTNPNNTSNDGKVSEFVSKKIDAINRQLSAWYTTRNPDFVASNFMRDTFYTNTIVRAKEGNSYANKFHKHYAKLLMPGKMMQLFYKYENGTLDSSKPVERDFLEFMMNGGETGYSNLKDLEHIKRKIAKELKGSRVQKVENVLERLDIVNRAVENTARFAAYRTSRQMGRTVAKSIFDAKEISVNFNKKGAGGTFFGMTGQTRMGNLAAAVGAGGRAFYVFFNAAIQGTTNLMHVMRVNPVGTGAGVAAMFLMGALIPMLLDDDDEKEYYDLPEHVRRNHLILPGMGDAWVSIPLPIEYRIMYGMGELLTSWRTGHERDKDIARKMLSLSGQALPLNFMEEGLNAFVPSVISPLWQAYNNRSWTGLPIYKDNEFNKQDPEYTKAYSNTDRNLVKFTKGLYEWTFDEENQSEGIDLNPAIIETIARGYFSGAFTTVSNLSKTLGTIQGEREFDWRNIPIGNRVFKTGDERTKEKRITNEYFENMEELEFMQSRERMLKKVINGAAVPEADKVEARRDYEIMQGSEAYKKFMDFKKKKKEVDKVRKTIKDKGTSEELEKKLSRLQDEANKLVK